MQRSELPHGFPVGDFPGPFDPDRIADLDLSIGAKRGQRRLRRQLHLRHLLVEKRREKQEFLMLKPEAGPPFGDAALAQDDALPAGSERFADQRPLFEASTHGLQDAEAASPTQAACELR